MNSLALGRWKYAHGGSLRAIPRSQESDECDKRGYCGLDPMFGQLNWSGSSGEEDAGWS